MQAIIPWADRRVPVQRPPDGKRGLAETGERTLQSLNSTGPYRPHWFAVEERLRMAKSKKKVETMFLVCEETGDYNYTIRRKTGGEKLKLSKYSPRLRKHTTHVEKKK
jgi:large subunit ribosomal protein L33